MIASLTGRITQTELGTVIIIDVGGVGYLVHGYNGMIYDLPSPQRCVRC